MKLGIQGEYGNDDGAQVVWSSFRVIGDAQKEDLILYNK